MLLNSYKIWAKVSLINQFTIANVFITVLDNVLGVLIRMNDIVEFIKKSRKFHVRLNFIRLFTSPLLRTPYLTRITYT